MVLVSFIGFCVSQLLEYRREEKEKTLLDSPLMSIASDSSSGIESDVSSSRDSDYGLSKYKLLKKLIKYLI